MTASEATRDRIARVLTDQSMVCGFEECSGGPDYCTLCEDAFEGVAGAMLNEFPVLAGPTDDYEAGYAEGFHHGLSTPRGSADSDRNPVTDAMVEAGARAAAERIADLEAEVERLRALTEAQAERGAAQRQQLDAARALHSREEFEDSPGVFFCSRCQRTAGLWPCETVAVLDGGDET